MQSKVSWGQFPKGVIAAQSEMTGMTGSSEAYVIVSIRHDGSYSVKCYRHGEFGVQGDGGRSIWHRVGSSLGLRSESEVQAAIDEWASEIDAYPDWVYLIQALEQAYPRHIAQIAKLSTCAAG